MTFDDGYKYIICFTLLAFILGICLKAISDIAGKQFWRLKDYLDGKKIARKAWAKSNFIVCVHEAFEQGQYFNRLRTAEDRIDAIVKSM
jgi:hypothetical protein